jgi:hypothetical protein
MTHASLVMSYYNLLHGYSIYQYHRTITVMREKGMNHCDDCIDHTFGGAFLNHNLRTVRL